MPQGMDQNGQMGSSTRGQRGQQGGPDQEMGGMEQMMTERFQELLGCTDEEWQVIGPRVLNLFTLSNQSSGSSMRSMFGRSSRGDDTNSRRDTDDSGSQEDELLARLQELLEEENPSTSEIKGLMNQIRSARQAVEQELAQAQKELRELLTVRQEAILFAMGLLD
jgi:hypothetical protein